MTRHTEPITGEQLLRLGLIFPVFGGLQIDLNVASRKMSNGDFQEASVCDHNCTAEVGGYNCGAALTLNKGRKGNFATGEELLNWIMISRQGAKFSWESWHYNYFSQYCEMFKIPYEVAPILAESISNHLFEVNLFGGNPEMHPEIIWLMRQLRNYGVRINLTTTGRKTLTNPDFVEGLKHSPPHVLALSADDFKAEELDRLFNLPLTELKAEWKNINPLHGQEQKFYEGIYTARLVQDLGIDTQVLFNMVLHKGNLRSFAPMFQAICTYLPKALINPYPAQDSFEHGEGDLFSGSDVIVFGDLVDLFIRETVRGNKNLTKRLSYWLVMRTVLDNFQEFPELASPLIAGHEIWKCYQAAPIPGAGLYVQLGKRDPVFETNSDGATPGGHLGCYWNNQTITQPQQLTSPQEITNHLFGGMQALAAQQTAVNRACPGCSMPRLWFNMITTELGLNPGLRQNYLDLRRIYAGF